jgi:hypothetical protein
MDSETPAPVSAADLPPSAAEAVHDRLRLIHLFSWMTASALCVQGSAWLDRAIGVRGAPRPFLTTTWLTVTFATALCSVPWLVARRLSRPGVCLQSGERLWILLAPLAIIRAWAVYGIPLTHDLGAFLMPAVFWCLSTSAFAFVAGRARQRTRWRIFFASLAWSLVLEAAAYLGLVTQDRTVYSLFLAIAFGCTLLLPFPFLAHAVVRDLMSSTRTDYRWSHWVGAAIYISGVALILTFHGETLLSLVVPEAE